MLNALISFITEADVLISWLIYNIMKIVFDCDKCLTWEISFNVSFFIKSDISLYFFQRISFQTQTVLNNSSMFCFSDIDISLYCCEFNCRFSVIVSKKLCSLLSSYELLWFVACWVLFSCNFETILHQTTASSWSD